VAEITIKVRNGSWRRSIIVSIVLVAAAWISAVSAQAAGSWVATGILQGAATDPTMQQYIAAHGDTFAGEWFTTDSGHAVYNVGFTRDKPVRARELSALFAYPNQLAVLTERYSLNELHQFSAQVEKQIGALAELGARVVTLGLDVPANVVAVGVSGAADSAKEYLTAHLHGLPVRVESTSSLNTVQRADDPRARWLNPSLLAFIVGAGCIAVVVAVRRRWSRRSRPSGTTAPS